MYIRCRQGYTKIVLFIEKRKICNSIVNRGPNPSVFRESHSTLRMYGFNSKVIKYGIIFYLTYLGTFEISDTKQFFFLT